eukprot:Sspe_Gene.113250::Locus_97239_Transcript_2_3_Confidence_0.500_Length_1998::g.113250::m.113250
MMMHPHAFSLCSYPTAATAAGAPRPLCGTSFCSALARLHMPTARTVSRGVIRDLSGFSLHQCRCLPTFTAMRNVVWVLVAVVLPVAHGGKKCGGTLPTPPTWEPVPGTPPDLDFIYTWTVTNDVVGYECLGDVTSCFVNFLPEFKEEDICNKVCPPAMPKIQRIVCVGKEVAAYFKAVTGQVFYRCFGHAGAFEEALDECGISADLVTRWSGPKKVPHSWVEVTVQHGTPPKPTKLVADCYNGLYALAPLDGGGSRRAHVLNEVEEECDPPVLDPACNAPTCGPTGLAVRKFTWTLAVDAEELPGVAATTDGLKLDNLPLTWLPDYLKPTAYHRVPGLAKGGTLEMQCCHPSGCVFYVVVYRCHGCPSSNGMLPKQLLLREWEARSCGPTFACSGLSRQPTTVFRKYFKADTTERTDPTETEAKHIGIFSVPKDQEYAMGKTWCPPPHKPSLRGAYSTRQMCHEYCCS